MQVRIPNNGCYHHYFSISILAILILYKTAEQSGLVWLVPWRICLRQAGPSNRRRAKSDAWRRCLAQAAFPGSDPNRPSYFHITQKHGSNIKFSNTEQCKNPIPRTWNTKPVMLLLSEDVEDHFRVVFSWQTYPAWEWAGLNGSVQPHFS